MTFHSLLNWCYHHVSRYSSNKINMEDNRRSHSPSEDCETKKRLRCSNFSSQERNILIHIIEKHQDVIESKKLDRRSVIERDSIWDVIAQEFNEMSLNEPVRTPRQLKQCYENLKRKIKQENALLIDSKTPKSSIDPMSFRTCTLEMTDDSNSAYHLEDSIDSQDETEGYRSVQYPITYYSEAFQRDASIEMLQRSLLSKQIQAANLDLEMKTRKYAVELKVEEAKLEYYKKKCQLLNLNANCFQKSNSN